MPKAAAANSVTLSQKRRMGPACGLAGARSVPVLHQPSRVRPEEQIAERAAQQISEPPLRQMVRAIVDHVAALAQALQIAPPVVTRVVVEVGCSKNNAGVPDLSGFDEIGPARWPSPAIAPGVLHGIEPAPVRQTANRHAVPPVASLTDTGGALEPHPPADLRPIARIKLPHFRSDRHRHPRLP